MVNYKTKEYKKIHNIDFYNYSIARFYLIMNKILFENESEEFLLLLNQDETIVNNFPLSMTTQKEAKILLDLGLVELKANNIVKIKNYIDYSSISEEDSLKFRHKINNLKKFILPQEAVGLNLMTLIIRDYGKCYYCEEEILTPKKQFGTTGQEKFATIDHVMPKGKGGKDVWENVVLCCSLCNMYKKNLITKKANKLLESNILQMPSLELLNTRCKEVPYYLSIFPENWIKYFNLNITQEEKLDVFKEKNIKNLKVLHKKKKQPIGNKDSFQKDVLDDEKIMLTNKEGDKFWYLNGQLGRQEKELPCIERTNGNKRYNLENGNYKIKGHLFEIHYNKNGKISRLDGPAQIYYYENGNIRYEKYYENGKLHKLDGPAIIKYYENRNIGYEAYYINGELDNKNSPAVTEYYNNGKIKSELYYKNNCLHNTDGPALVKYNDNGNIKNQEYYINGEIQNNNRLSLSL